MRNGVVGYACRDGGGGGMLGPITLLVGRLMYSRRRGLCP